LKEQPSCKGEFTGRFLAGPNMKLLKMLQNLAVNS
jgi:hypothetical protein